jgi:hypothetical protein
MYARFLDSNKRGLPMSKLVTNPVQRGVARRSSVLGIAVAAALALPQVAAAMEFDLGREDLTFRWDNTFRVNIADRVAGQDADMLANPNYDDGDRNFDTGSIWTRFDLYSEADIVWKPSWGTLGARLSAAGWWDPGYDTLDNESVQTENHLKNGNPALGLSDYTKRYHEGASGEFMDWFVFGSFTVGEAPVNVKVGQTTVYWGESLLLGGAIHGISYSQNPIDVMKGLSTPGAEAKELFRPRVGFNINSQVTDDLNIAAQYFFNWQQFSNQAYRYPESGSYLTVQDGLLWGGDSIIAGLNPLYGQIALPPPGGVSQASPGFACWLAASPGFPSFSSTCAPQQYNRLWRGKDITPDENSGNFGIAVRWSPEWVNGTLGFYYRRTYDMQPQVMVAPDVLPVGLPGLPPNSWCTTTLGGLVVAPGKCLQGSLAGFVSSGPLTGLPILTSTGKEFVNQGRAGTYNTAFGSDIDIYGISLSKQIGSLSLGAEVSYRTDMPLLSDPITVFPSAYKPYDAVLRNYAGLGLVPSGYIYSDKIPKNDTPATKGDTLHALVNLLGIMGESNFWDTANWSAELTYMTWLDVTQNEGAFKGRSDKSGQWKAYTLIDKVDKNYFGLGINFTPTWFQVLPGMDVLAPLSWSQGISGNSAVTSGGQEGAGSFGLGVALDFYQRYRFDLKYIGFYGDHETCKQAASEFPAVGTCAGASPSDVAVFNGTNAVLADRDYIALTFKTTF